MIALPALIYWRWRKKKKGASNVDIDRQMTAWAAGDARRGAHKAKVKEAALSHQEIIDWCFYKN